MSDITLVVRGDDFGMCHGVNLGFVKAFREGILTQASTMVPCPWFNEAVELAKEHDIPLGIHLTATCEWNRVRWGPLTRTESLAMDDGGFWHDIPSVREKADPDELLAEYIAQIERFLAAGIEPAYIDHHMGWPRPEVIAEAVGRFSIPFIAPESGVPGGKEPFDQVISVTTHDCAHLLERLESLPPGLHMAIAHPAVASPEVAAMNVPPMDWTESYRASDLEILTHPDVRAVIERRGIRLASMLELDLRDLRP